MLSSWSHYFSATVNAEVAARVQQLADTFAATCMAQRHFVVQRMEGNDILAADPRMLAFEFIFSIMLRKSQVRLVRLFADSVARNESKCHQMIMGAGKSTVISPLLNFLLLDGNRFSIYHLGFSTLKRSFNALFLIDIPTESNYRYRSVVQVVPKALLQFAQTISREAFAAVVPKPVFSLSFDRFMDVTPTLYYKLGIKAYSLLTFAIFSVRRCRAIFILFDILYCRLCSSKPRGSTVHSHGYQELSAQVRGIVSYYGKQEGQGHLGGGGRSGPMERLSRHFWILEKEKAFGYKGVPRRRTHGGLVAECTAPQMRALQSDFQHVSYPGCAVARRSGSNFASAEI